MKKLFVIFFVLFLLAVPRSYAQTASQSAETPTKYGITFPVSALGGCTSVANCKAYCDDAAHKDACIAFAKQKGFYKQSEQSKRQEHLITEAKTELGCNSKEACMALCQQPENADKCSAFAKKFGTPNSNKEKTQNPQVLEKAKQMLGCSSETLCKAFCQDEANKDKCSTFAKTVGLHGGERKVGPGGCESESSCKEFCTAHPDVCKQYLDEAHKKREMMASGSGIIKAGSGPGGCNSMESCTKYCGEHQDECKSFIKTNTNGKMVPQQMEQAQKIAGEYEKNCKEHPEKCKDLMQKFVRPNAASRSGQFYQDDYCQKNPVACKARQENKQGAYSRPEAGKNVQYQQQMQQQRQRIQEGQGEDQSQYPSKQVTQSVEEVEITKPQ